MDGLTQRGDPFYTYEPRGAPQLDFPPSAEVFGSAPYQGWDAQKMFDSVASGGGGPVPFGVSIVNDLGPYAAIASTGYLNTALDGTRLTITDLTAQFLLESTTKVWIQVTVDGALAPTAAARMTGTAFPALVVTSGSPAAQTQFNVRVGQVVSLHRPTEPGFDFEIGGSEYHFEQMLNSHLLVSNLCYNGTPVIYAFPWSGV